MKTILRKLPIIIPTILLLLLLISISACKTTSYQVSDDDSNLESSETSIINSPQEQKQEKVYTSEGIKKGGIKIKDDRIIIKSPTKDIPKVTISDETRKQMLRDAKQATKEKRYEDAVKIANAILEARPGDESVLALKENARLLMEDKRHNAIMDQLERVDSQERSKYFENLREKAIPYDDMMKFTTKEKWEDIKKRAQKEEMSKSKRLDENREHTERLQVAPSPSQNILSQDMGNALNKKLSIEFIDTPLRDVVVFLQEKTKVNFVLDKDAAATNTNINIKLNDVSVSTVLNYILPKGLDYVVKDNVVHITLEPLELRVYDVRDLLINLEDRQSLEAAAATEEGGESTGESKDTFDRVQEIISLITDTIEPASWSINGGRGRIAAREGMLGDIVVTHVAGIHKQTEDLLAALRSSADLQIAIEARFIQVSDNFLEEVGNNILDFDTTSSRPSETNPKGTPGENTSGGREEGIFTETDDTFADSGVISGAAAAALGEISGTTGLSLSYQILNGFFLEGFLRAVQESDEAETLTAPKITLSNTQRGTIKVVTTFNFIVRFEIVSQTPEPIVEEIDSGTTLNVRPIVSADRKYVYLEVHPIITRVNLDDRIDFETIAPGVSQAGGGAVATNTIILPRIDKQELSVTVCVPDKGILMIGGLSSMEETKSSSGVPILSKIPIIKRLFSSNKIDRKIDKDDNLIILVKPTILIREEQEVRAFANGRKDVEFVNPLR